MAESTLSLSRDELREDVARYLGYSRSKDAWSATELGRVDKTIRDGLSDFYFPLVGEEVYSWSFLQPTATLTTASGDEDYDLPDNFCGVLDDLSQTSGAGSTVISIVSIEQLLQLKAREAASDAQPLYAAVRPKTATTSTSSGQRFEILLYPQPNATYTLTYHYAVLPDQLPDDRYPLGGMAHSQTVKAACLAAAERHQQPDQDGKAREYERRLMASVAMDRNIRERSEENWHTTEPTVGTLDWLIQQLGGKAFGKWNKNALNHHELSFLTSVANRGINRFYRPHNVGEAAPYRWSFLSSSGTVTLATGQLEYNLPSGFEGMRGRPYFPSNSGEPSLQQMKDTELRSSLAVSHTNGTPRYFSVFSKSTTHTAEHDKKMAIYPPPAVGFDSVVLTFRYDKTPPELTSSTTFPSGGSTHAETILTACLSVLHEGTDQGPAADAAYAERLSGSIAVDKKVDADSVTAWTLTAPAFGTYTWLRQEIGNHIEAGANPDSWGHDTVRKIDSITHRGLNSFYFPPPVDERRHAWHFLTPRATITLVMSDSAYDLPAGFSGVIENVTWPDASGLRPMREIRPDQFRSKMSESSTDGTPSYYSVVPKTTANTSDQLWEMNVYPPPDASRVVTYQYRLTPGDLSTSAEYPYGGKAHAQTILAACLAVADEGTDRHPQSYQIFVDRLKASVETDVVAQEAVADLYPATTVTYGTYDWLQQEIGMILGIGPSPVDWGYGEERKVNSIQEQGLRKFIQSPRTGVAFQRAHVWTFMSPLTTLTLTAPYETGTVEVTLGVVTLTGGTWPSWAASGELTIGGVSYTVNTRDSTTQLTLDDLTADADSLTTYSLAQTIYDLPSTVRNIQGDLTYQPGETVFGSIKVVDEHSIRASRQSEDWSGYPRVAAIYPKPLVNGTGKEQLIQFWPSPNSAYVLSYRYSLELTALVAGDYLPGGTIHANAILAACRSVIDPKEWHPRFLESLASSIDTDQAEHGAPSLGQNRDLSDGTSGSFHDSTRASSYEGTFY